MTSLDKTHDHRLKSFVKEANGHKDFPIQNLPFGIFSLRGDTPRGGIAIGDHILDIAAVKQSGLLPEEAAKAAETLLAPQLNDFFKHAPNGRHVLRQTVSNLLSEESPDREKVGQCLVKASEAQLHRPFNIGDYTDFYVGIHHASHVGALFRPDNPLMANYKYVPIGYHGRASSVIISGNNIRRPNGQRKAAGQTVPEFGPCQRLDYELELGLWIGRSNKLGEPIRIDDAEDYIGGFCLLNDWSARDIQAWEYQPLGPFLAKNFASTISPWVITPEALAPYRISQPARPAGDPAPLPYLDSEADRKNGAYQLSLEVQIRTAKMRDQGLPPFRLGLSNAKYMYWTMAQMIAHHSSNGCNLQIGDLLGTGTISGPDQNSCGSILEVTEGGKKPVTLENGEERRFLEDGDEIILIARTEEKDGVQIGFGECRAIVEPAVVY